ncbi:MAG: subclass B3 metallo-beta-lactamase [Brevundimonas sp.]|uniref:subclass B3 metallo-beta-lactamase n=1 Tax=Brevundimonas sp. TaxID=1871086 RepID=UPI002735C77D|nr:subclass B3 metallo-beta-lactamase [Brevundimonas sp.]MDP3405474.1 subclass B3 metallo-beta-lactamase [Brevundimonas sp.]
MIRWMTAAAVLGGLGALAGVPVDEAHGPRVAGPVAVSVQVDDPLTRPMAVERAPTWLAPRPPEKLFGDTWLVGFGGLSVALIDTGAGLVLIDGALPQAAPMILDNVRRLGFDPKDIKFILSTEPHFDHAGGLAALVRDTGATVVASTRAAEGLRTGAHAPDDPQLGYGGTWPRVTQVRGVEDGEVLVLGNTRITAQATPGHTMGSMSWSWEACEAGTCKAIVFASSLNPVSFPGYRYTAPSSAGILNGFTQSYRRLDGLACDILISPHPDNAGDGRYDSRPGACRTYVERSRRLLAARLATERGETVP